MPNRNNNRRRNNNNNNNRRTAQTTRAPHASTSVHEQTGENCFAYPIATAIREAITRRYGPDRCPSHDILVHYMTQRFDRGDGASLNEVLAYVCGGRTGLSVRSVNLRDALRYSQRRVVVASFEWRDYQQIEFERYFAVNPTGRFPGFNSSASRRSNSEMGRHAVAIVGSNTDSRGNDYFYVKNSWGSGDADGGYFRVYVRALPFDEFYVIQ